jgi:hypothetical protein
MEHIKTQSGGKVLSEPGHEGSDVNIPLVLGFGVFLFVSGVILNIVMYGFYKGLDKWYEHNQQPASPMVQTETVKGEAMTQSQFAESQQQALKRIVATFPEPRLLSDEYTDYARKKQQDMDQISQYSWVNESTGTVRIPVSRAIDILAERGLPNIGPGKAPAAAGTPAAPAAAAPAPAKGAAKKQ